MNDRPAIAAACRAPRVSRLLFFRLQCIVTHIDPRTRPDAVVASVEVAQVVCFRKDRSFCFFVDQFARRGQVKGLHWIHMGASSHRCFLHVGGTSSPVLFSLSQNNWSAAIYTHGCKYKSWPKKLTSETVSFQLKKINKYSTSKWSTLFHKYNTRN